MRGEHTLKAQQILDAPGSSPHARGAPSLRRPRASDSGDHPRMRGEHPLGFTHRFCLVGSSPHARGALVRVAFGPRPSGDHPRMRGEHVFIVTPSWMSRGSSPHARGAPRRCRRPPSRRRDHPRMRGEHDTTVESTGHTAGSSPHARGAPGHSVPAAHGRGIIPACAGSTGSARWASGGCGDHPRMRGEHREALRTEISTEGSSPHARGAPHEREDGALVGGIIPACAGST